MRTNCDDEEGVSNLDFVNSPQKSKGDLKREGFENVLEKFGWWHTLVGWRGGGSWVSLIY